MIHDTRTCLVFSLFVAGLTRVSARTGGVEAAGAIATGAVTPPVRAAVAGGTVFSPSSARLFSSALRSSISSTIFRMACSLFSMSCDRASGSSAARLARSSWRVVAGTCAQASMRSQGVCGVSYRLVTLLPTRVFSINFMAGVKWLRRGQPGGFVEVVDHFNEPDVVVAAVTEELPDMGEVFLLNVRLVVLFVGARAGPAGWPGLVAEVPFEGGVEELAAVVAIESEHFKGHPGFDPAQPAADFAAGLTPQPGEFGPAGVDVREGQAPHEFAAAAAASMRDGVGFQPAGPVHFPRAATHGDAGFEAVAGAALAAAVTLVMAEPVDAGDAVELAPAASQDFLADACGKLAVAGFITPQPERQGGFEPLATGLLAAFPDLDDDGFFRLGVGRLGTALARLFAKADLAVEGFDRVLAIPAERVADLVDHRASPGPVPARITRAAAV